MISFKTTRKDEMTILKIADRARALYYMHAPAGSAPFDKVSCEMDVAACHVNGTPLRLNDLLNADDFHFLHDIIGLRDHMDREKTGQPIGFRPRFAARDTTN